MFVCFSSCRTRPLARKKDALRLHLCAVPGRYQTGQVTRRAGFRPCYDLRALSFASMSIRPSSLQVACRRRAGYRYAPGEIACRPALARSVSVLRRWPDPQDRRRRVFRTFVACYRTFASFRRCHA